MIVLIAPVGAAVLLLLVARAWRRLGRKLPGPRRDHYPRPRHSVRAPVIWLLTPLFQYSHVRGAYVVRLVGDQHGPVLVRREEQRLGQHTEADRG